MAQPSASSVEVQRQQGADGGKARLPRRQFIDVNLQRVLELEIDRLLPYLPLLLADDAIVVDVQLLEEL